MLDYLVRALLVVRKQLLETTGVGLVHEAAAARARVTLDLRSLWPRLWRRSAEYRLKPFAVLRKRLAAARLVFNLGID